MDEPTSALTRHETDNLLQLLRRIKKRRRHRALCLAQTGRSAGGGRSGFRTARRQPIGTRPNCRTDQRADCADDDRRCGTLTRQTGRSVGRAVFEACWRQPGWGASTMSAFARTACEDTLASTGWLASCRMELAEILIGEALKTAATCSSTASSPADPQHGRQSVQVSHGLCLENRKEKGLIP